VKDLAISEMGRSFGFAQDDKKPLFIAMTNGVFGN
jgi:hypothetical protein